MTAALDQQAAAGGLAIESIGALAVAVADPSAARDFYCRILGGVASGSDVLPECRSHELIRFPAGQMLALARAGNRPDLSETGVHQAYRATAGAAEAIAGRLQSGGIQIRRYREDREAEQGDRLYFFDPDGNRVQIVIRDAAVDGEGIYGIDHAAVQVPDMLWAGHFYGTVLGLEAESRFGLRTADHALARVWAAGEDDMAPGTRRLDKLYMTMGGQNEVPRTNMQVYYTVGEGVIGVYLATAHFQEPPEDQLAGVPRMILQAPRAALDIAAARLETEGRPYLGPVPHPASAPFSASLYFKDTGGNFFEICSPGGS
ncbi:MAG: VOC family protein [Alphaproteobacteria bacterium]|nr:VOC family protein [Alphaproteobacteria bacterium]